MVILIDSVFRIGGSYYPQVFLEKCKYVVKEKKMPKFVAENVEIFFGEEKSSDQEN